MKLKTHETHGRLDRLRQEEHRCLTTRLEEERQVNKGRLHLPAVAPSATLAPETSKDKGEPASQEHGNELKTERQTATLLEAHSDPLLASFLARRQKLPLAGTIRSARRNGSNQDPARGGMNAFHGESEKKRSTARRTNVFGQLDNLLW